MPSWTLEYWTQKVAGEVMVYWKFIFSSLTIRHATDPLLFQIPFPEGQSIHIKTTHPHVLYVLAFLLSAVAKRDAVGRKPKKGLFAREGLGVLEREGWGDVLVSGGCGEEQEGRVEFWMTGPGTKEILRVCFQTPRAVVWN
jgi:hypothetical protein